MAPQSHILSWAQVGAWPWGVSETRDISGVVLWSETLIGTMKLYVQSLPRAPHLINT